MKIFALSITQLLKKWDWTEKQKRRKMSQRSFESCWAKGEFLRNGGISLEWKSREQRCQEEIVVQEKFTMDMEETQKSGFTLCWDPANSRTSTAAGFMGMLLLDSIFHPAPHFFFREPWQCEAVYPGEQWLLEPHLTKSSHNEIAGLTSNIHCRSHRTL